MSQEGKARAITLCVDDFKRLEHERKCYQTVHTIRILSKLVKAILCLTTKLRINRNAALQLVWHCLGRTKADSLPDYLHPELSRNANRRLISHSDHGKKRYDLSHYAVNFRSASGTVCQVTKVPFLPPEKVSGEQRLLLAETCPSSNIDLITEKI